MFDKNSALGLPFDVESGTYSFKVEPSDPALQNDMTRFRVKPSYLTFVPGLYLSGVTFNVAVGTRSSPW